MSIVKSLFAGVIDVSFGTLSNEDGFNGTITPAAMPANGTAGQVFAVADAPGIGGRASRSLTWQSITGGTVSAISLVIQGSLDGVNWVQIATSTNAAGDSGVVNPMQYRFVRAYLTLSTNTNGTLAVAFKLI